MGTTSYPIIIFSMIFPLHTLIRLHPITMKAIVSSCNRLLHHHCWYRIMSKYVVRIVGVLWWWNLAMMNQRRRCCFHFGHCGQFWIVMKRKSGEEAIESHLTLTKSIVEKWAERAKIDENGPPWHDTLQKRDGSRPNPRLRMCLSWCYLLICTRNLNRILIVKRYIWF